MESTPTVRRDRRRRRRLLAFLLSATAVGTLTSTALSLALFTSAATVNANGFSAGTIILQANGCNDAYTAPKCNLGTVDFGTGTMFPDDVVTGRILVENVGNGDLRYAMTSTTGGALLNALDVTITAQAGDHTCPGGAAIVATRALSGVAIGNPAPGDQGSDRPLAPGDSETLCFAVHMARSADSTYQGTTASAQFVFQAEQTKNN